MWMSQRTTASVCDPSIFPDWAFTLTARGAQADEIQ